MGVAGSDELDSRVQLVRLLALHEGETDGGAESRAEATCGTKHHALQGRSRAGVRLITWSGHVNEQVVATSFARVGLGHRGPGNLERRRYF